MEWFRMYSEFASDAKVQSMSEAMQRRLMMLLCLRCSNALVTLQNDEIAFALRISEAELSETKVLFLKKGFVDESWEIMNWDKRQFISDSSAARVAKHRAAKKEGRQHDQTAVHPNSNVTVTPQNRTETEQNRTDSVPNGTGADAPSGQSEKPVEQMTKDELWAAGKSLLQQSGMPGKQCGSFVGKLVKDYGSEIVIEAVQSAVVERPADPASFLKAACMARKGEGGKTLIPWHATDSGVIAKGEGMDPPMRPHPGESMLQFKARLLAAIENDGKPPDPKPKPALVITNEAKGHKPEGLAPLKSLIKIREPA